MEEMNQLKVFTVDEANQLLPKLTAWIRELQEKRGAILSLEVEIDALELVADKDQNGGLTVLNNKIEEYTRTVNRFYGLADEIHELGCFLKDIDQGLVDFYTLYKGRVVYLCWQMGEPEVAHWHEIGRGYTYRQPIITEEQGRESSG